MNDINQCPVCDEPVEPGGSDGGYDGYNITCPRCGKYRIVGSALPAFNRITRSPRIKANISGWLRENQTYEIHSENINKLMTIKTPSFHERADKLLLYFEKKTTYAGELLKYDISWLSIGYCVNFDELSEMINYLTNEEYIVDFPTFGDHTIKILPDGWAQLEELKNINADSQQCFVAMWFDDSMQHIYDEIISEAVYDAGYKPHRVDKREHNEKIDDEIIAQIKRSRFVLADFTGHRGGVYYEAGFAKGLGLEVFWTCREDEIEKLHFDIRQYNCIPWQPGNEDDFKRKITNRIEAVIGYGEYKRDSKESL
ncbi:MAG: hypothetical protein JXB48_20535 [Candidatus Latescibacteria bacterium]|nr:hypothetical protein [Candidatus Latescibacterota bacterium]